MIEFKRYEFLNPQSRDISKDLHKQLLALRNYKHLEIINQSNKDYNLPWLSNLLENLKNLDLEGRDKLLNRPAIYVWLETAKTILTKSDSQQQKWRLDGFIELALSMWVHYEIIPHCFYYTATEDTELFYFRNRSLIVKLKADEKIQIHVKDGKLLFTTDSSESYWSREHLIAMDKGKSVFFLNQAPWINSYLNLITPADLRMEKMELVTKVSGGILNLFVEALDLIKQFWPEMYDELYSNVHHIVFFEPPGLPFFSDFRVHGVIFAAHMERSILKIAEWIVHEASHIRLNTLMCARPHLSNSMELRYPSPWRDDPRPLYGIYHGCFVHSRVLKFYRLVNEKTHQFSGVISEEIDRITTELQAGLSVVKENGILTDEGKSMVSEMYKNLI
ncbi:hypothetical protein CN900_14475 [Bacillus anthracis]|uniref:aKG-HExxH-type peptide beta-hydroxylase n=1 Tax=Bacillus sp. N35-10-4 TaxID=1866315 RepID=UPI0008FDFAA7|nr:HEXXH motif-containing putative peptide modification protein [Bacillus sp. N35-10-4]OJD55688.1 hypothetical protein BAU26_25860 [Bacillus sp. N35-10-4]PFM20616.1 hypothetical protein COJ44_06315 [Bacillus anthracis]PGH91975.1 hypothetical protein CN900_14475 [Bacillus anthracis]PGP22911.1 hypothetical protein CN994_14700 [Bacillus anthracis]